MAAQIDWYFSDNPDGDEHGFADAGMETFRKRLYDSLARETIQNSLDARVDHNAPVRVTFDCESVAMSDLPAANTLRDAVKRCGAFWAPNKKSVKFFSKAEELLRKRKVSVFQVADFNTTGLEGSDTRRNSNWHSLIRAVGASSKQSGEGGSFGIGASAPFAASQLRTVFYSTVAQKEGFGFIGVSRLTTHQNANGVKVNPNGHLGVEGGKRVDDAKLVPKVFRRSERGTTVSIIGFKETSTWQDEFKVGVLEHFWPAIHFGKLVVTIGKTKIEAANLERHLQWAADEHKSDAIAYWRCIADAASDGVYEYSDALKHLGSVQIHLRSGDPKLPKKVAMVRQPGMIVWRRTFHSPAPFCGVFRCENTTGNAKLRDMEPPEHNLWTGDLPEKGENKKVEREFLTYIKEKIRELTQVDEEEALEVPNLGRFLPDDLNGKGQSEADGNGEPMPKNAEIPTSPIGSKLPRATTNELGDTAPVSGSGDGRGSGESEENGESREGRGTGDGDGGRRQVEVPIETRAFSQDAQGKKYSLVVRPSDHLNHDVDLTLRIVGEDRSDPVEIATVTKNGKPLAVSTNGRITSLKLKGTESALLELVLSSPRRVSLEVLAHED